MYEGLTELSMDQVRDREAQLAIADALRYYTRIDLTIPAQRAVANQVRLDMGMPVLAPLSDDTQIEPVISEVLGG